MKTWYKVRFRFGEIEPVEVIKETPKTVTVQFGSNGGYNSYWYRTERKESYGVEYHDNWKDAHNALYQYQLIKVEAIRNDLEREKGRLGQIKGMTEPEKQNPR